MYTRATALCALLFALVVATASSNCAPTDCSDKQICGPETPADQPAWLASWQQWRKSCLRAIQYNGSIFDEPQLRWTQTSYIQPQMHPYDRYFFDPSTGSYTVQRWLDDLRTRYGGIDSVLVWPTYTNMGVDDRNQFDMIEAMPGGISGLKDITEQLHAENISVLFPYHPWDTGTRRSPQSDPDALANLLTQINADGFNGDTMTGISSDFYLAGLKDGKALALQSEGDGVPAGLNYITIGWGENLVYPFVPTVDKFKFLDSRRMLNVCNRWAQNHTDDLHYAFFNGLGFESWENVWGVWNRIVDRDAEAIRRVGTILRFFGADGILNSQNWIPHTHTLQHWTVFASRFNMGEASLWTLVNRGSLNTTGEQLNITKVPGTSWRCFDVWHGEELPCEGLATAGQQTLSFDIEGSGFGCVYITPTPSSDFLSLLSTMKNLSTLPLAAYSTEWSYLQQENIVHTPTPVPAAQPNGTVHVPGGLFRFQSSGVEIESDDAHGVDVQFPWEMHPRRSHDQYVTVGDLYVDQFPVTCKQYQAFLQASQYQPRDQTSFLKNWSNGQYPSGYANKPVTYVSLSDATAYCAFYNKRLPEAWEWQYFAQGNDSRLYPWGNTPDTSRYPPVSNSTTIPGPTDVTAYVTNGSSPFGVADLIGNVWQYTSVFQDDHTRAVLVRGSSNYYPGVQTANNWYFPRALQLNQHNKYFLFSDGYERAGTIGFRCVADASGPYSCSASLCGRVDTPAAYTDLTDEGSVDWVHFGIAGANTSAVVMDRKTLYIPAVANITFSNSSALEGYTNNPTAFSWRDGTISSTSPNVTTGAYLQGNGSSFSFSVPSMSGQQQLRVYVGVYNANATLTAKLIDYDGYVAGSYVEDRIQGEGHHTVVFHLSYMFWYPADLFVTWTQTGSTSPDGHISLQAVTLSLK